MQSKDRACVESVNQTHDNIPDYGAPLHEVWGVSRPRSVHCLPLSEVPASWAAHGGHVKNLDMAW